MENEHQRIADLEAKIEALADYCQHDPGCPRVRFEAGQPTENGGYEVKIAGKWYQLRPVDETPKCDCGLDELLPEKPEDNQ